MDEDKGHVALMDDLTDIYQEATKYEFHDFKNEKYSAPKMALVQMLNGILAKLKDGKYDN